MTCLNNLNATTSLVIWVFFAKLIESSAYDRVFEEVVFQGGTYKTIPIHLRSYLNWFSIFFFDFPATRKI